MLVFSPIIKEIKKFKRFNKFNEFKTLGVSSADVGECFKQQTINNKQQTTNNKHQTPNPKHPTPSILNQKIPNLPFNEKN
jgi:hypothetical protein